MVFPLGSSTSSNIIILVNLTNVPCTFCRETPFKVSQAVFWSGFFYDFF